MDNIKTNVEWVRYKKLMEERPYEFKSCKELEIIVDESIVEAFEENTHRTIGVVYESPFRLLVVDLVYDGGDYFAYERLLPKVDAGAVVIVPICRGKCVLLSQFRHAMRDMQYAFPRGFATKGLSAEENCKKELEEEIGAIPKTVEFMGNVVADSGLSGEKVSVYLCEIDSYEVKEGYEGIDSVLELWPEEFHEYVIEGKIIDGYSLAAYAMYRSRYAESHEKM